jgi:hypothetical protein
MTIKIKTEKIVSLKSGRIARKILKIEALSKQDLPAIYAENKSNKSDATTYMEEDRKLKIFYKFQMKRIQIGDEIDEKDFQEMLEIIKEAGNNLKKINQKIKDKQKEWNGRETFKI